MSTTLHTYSAAHRVPGDSGRSVFQGCNAGLTGGLQYFEVELE
jgi:hypothetical protein